MSLIRVCDICGRALDRDHTFGVYTIKKKIFTPMYKWLDEKIEKLEVCDSCMEEVIREVLRKRENKRR